MRFLVLFALLAAVVLALAPSAFSGPDRGTRTGTVGGTVLDARGTIVANAEVTLRGITPSGAVYSDAAVTGRDGSFVFTRVPAGRYVVSSAVRGLGSDRERIGLRPGGAVRVSLILH